MKEKVIIFGTSEYSEYVSQTIIKEGTIEILGFTVDRAHYVAETFANLPVFVLEDLPLTHDMEICGILITVGYTKMNLIRKAVYEKCKSLGYRIATYVSSRAICDSNSIGEGCIVMPMSYIPPITRLGVCNVVNTASIIGHTCLIGDFNWFSGNITMGGNVVVDNNCFIGMNCLLKNGIHVKSQTMIGAYSYLNDDSVEGRFYSGNPAVNTKHLKSEVVCDFI